ncbi:MAG: hypothetical protein ACR2QE_15975 [Acidimicrobiales bacterium]
METHTEIVQRRRMPMLLGLLAVMALVASGCVFLPAAVNHNENNPTTRPWWCHSTGNGGHHVDPAYAGMTKGMLTWQECFWLSAQFDLTIDYAMQWPTLGDAEDAGFHRLVNYVEGMGTHHSMLGDFDPTDPSFDPTDPEFPGTEIDSTFHPARPEFLMYEGNSRSSELVGFAWYVKGDPTTPPEGFPGDNDWWHRHEVLCHQNSNWRVIGEDQSDTWCENRGGTNVYLGDYWMTHAWILDGWQTRADVFTNHHPCLLPGGPATDPEDPCWDIANGGGGHGH